MSSNPQTFIRQLYVLRHAKSSWSQPGAADFDRPLNDRGRRAAVEMGKRMASAGLEVDVVLASTANRVRETLDLLLPAWSYGGPILWERQIYLATVPTLIENLSALDGDWRRVLVVGHNPGLSELVGWLTETSVDMPTAALVALESSADQSAGWDIALRHRPWKQNAFWRPKD